MCCLLFEVKVLLSQVGAKLLMFIVMHVLNTMLHCVAMCLYFRVSLYNKVAEYVVAQLLRLILPCQHVHT